MRKILLKQKLALIATALFTTVVTAQTITQTFNYTGSMQTFTVPSCVSQVTIETVGASGGSVSIACSATGGKGARMIGTFSVTTGQVLSILVGGKAKPMVKTVVEAVAHLWLQPETCLDSCRWRRWCI